ncbi:MAG: antitoxin VapB family protein [Gemmatimonadota bacterium]|jgi:DNA polymerase III delta prime subunit
MPTKTISLRLEAYERLRRARLRPDESFSDVVMRAQWPGSAMTAGELREVYRAEGAHLTEDELSAIEEVETADWPDEDKWSEG